MVIIEVVRLSITVKAVLFIQGLLTIARQPVTANFDKRLKLPFFFGKVYDIRQRQRFFLFDQYQSKILHSEIHFSPGELGDNKVI